MKTSNFVRWGRAKWPGAISIARKPFPWFSGPSYLDLAPPPLLLARAKAGRVTWGQYIDQYLAAVLGWLDPAEVAADLQRLAGDAEPILLCWCGKGKPCHRRIVAAWLGEALGMEVPEL